MTRRVSSILRKPGKRWFSREDGSSTVEFVLIFPLFLILFTATFELGFLMTRYMMFDRALDVAVRSVKLMSARTGEPIKPEQVERLMCSRMIRGGRPCLKNLTLEMRRLSDGATWDIPENSVTCRNFNEEIVPVTEFTIGTPNDVMLIRACLSAHPFFKSSYFAPFLHRDSQDRFNMIATSAFAVEPQ